MSREFFQYLITSLVFEQLSKETKELVNSVMSTHAKAMDTVEVVAKENVHGN